MKKSKNENVILNHIDSKKGDVCRLIDALLEEISNRERISGAPLNQLSSVVGTLIDKFSVNEKASSTSGGELTNILEYFKDIK